MVIKEELINFESEIRDLFLDGQIKAPIHLSQNNEDALIEIFKDVKPEDWVCSTHRSHYHALLKGIPSDWLKSEIIDGRSMHINSKEHKFITSSIVCGCVPIAVGLAMSIKRKGLKECVWCFIGDMAASVGIFYECAKYAARNGLNIHWVIEDNEYATNTPTEEAWGKSLDSPRITKYWYQRGEYGHINISGKYVVFR